MIKHGNIDPLEGSEVCSVSKLKEGQMRNTSS